MQLNICQSRLAPSWSETDTERWLNRNPLKDCVSDHTYLARGYGYWLHWTPRYPGVFAKIHRMLSAMKRQTVGDN